MKSKCGNIKNKRNFLDLHENLFYEIFRYLDPSEVYFSLRNVCCTLRRYVQNNIQLRGTFMFISGVSNKRDVENSSHPIQNWLNVKILHAFKINDEIVPVLSNVVLF